MPRAFTEQEKDRIHRRLVSAGQELFTAYGLKRTSVAELARSAGISKGAFYLFFDSKEALFMEVLEAFERDMRAHFLSDAFHPGDDPRQSFKTFLVEALDVLESHPLFQTLDHEDLPYLMQRLSPERLEAHIHGDEQAMEAFLQAYRRAGHLKEQDPKVLSGLVRALFFVRMHRNEIGADVFPQVLDLMVDMVAGHLIEAS